MSARIALVLLASVAIAQTPEPLKFEVASIKPHPVRGFVVRIPDGQFHGIKGSTFIAEVSSVRDLIMDAYDLKEHQLIGLPEWTTSGSEVFDIEARVEADRMPTVPEAREMLQSLLLDRFQLRVHRETRNIPVYEIVQGKNGTKLEPTERGLKMLALIKLLSNVSDRPIIDKTGLEGGFKLMALDFDGLRRAQKADADGASVSIFSEVEEKWGLKLEPKNGPMEVLVIDHVERPSSN